MKPRADLLVAAAVVATASFFLAVWTTARNGPASFDIYMYYLPNMLYALQRLPQHGSGLLWNPFQNCGQPSFGISSTGMLYPANIAFFMLPPETAVLAVTTFNLVVGGLGAYYLCRELGTGRAAAWCGAVTFQLGNASVDLNTWGPQMGGAFVWIPASMWCCERLIRRPALRTAVGLAATLALPLLTGFPQTVVYAYQLIALRLVWALVVDRPPLARKGVGLIVLGLVLAPLLIAVQLLPGIENAALSVRGGNLTVGEVRSLGFLTWEGLMTMLAQRREISNPLIAVPAVVATASWLHPRARSSAGYYTLVATLYFMLSFGPATPLFALYESLPAGRLFRDPFRLLWLPSFCLAVLTALGVDTVLTQDGATRWRRYAAIVLSAAALLVLYVLYPGRLTWGEMVLGTAVVGATVLGALHTGARAAAGTTLVIAVTLGVTLFAADFLPRGMYPFITRNVPFRQWLPDEGTLSGRALALVQLKERMTPQDRVFFVHEPGDFSLMPKSASLFAVPAVQDYEPQAGRRYAEYFVLMSQGFPMNNLLNFYYPHAVLAPRHKRRLLDLAGARFIVADPEVDQVLRIMRPAPMLLPDLSENGLHVYENTRAMPRAYWIPRLEVIPDPHVMLHRLAKGREDPRQVAFVEVPPASGFLGEPGAPTGGSVEFVRNGPEHLVLRVQAPAHGFLHLTDQYYPGWRARLNGSDAPILRANFVFRAIEVPAGESIVEFRFTPWTVRLGAAVSAVTLLGVVAALAIDARRRRRAVRSRGQRLGAARFP